MSKVRLGFIGAGWWATTNHMPILAARDDVEMVGVCALGSDILEVVKEKFGFQMTTEDYRELLDLDLDGVVVTTPHSFHYEHASAALARGRHVLCEKPMTLNAEQAWTLVQLAHDNNVELIVPYGWHYKPFTQQAKQWMDDGAVGKVEYVLCHMASPTKDFFAGGNTVPTTWTPTIAAPDPRTWQMKERGGGYAHGQLTHASALAFWLTGLRAYEVSCRMTSPNSGVDMYNAASVTFDGDAIGTFSGAATLPDDDKFQVDIRIFGTEGAMMIDAERERLIVRRHDGKHMSMDVPDGQGAYSCETPPERFIDLIHGRGRNDSPGEVAARSVELIDAMHQSAAHDGRLTRVYRQPVQA